MATFNLGNGVLFIRSRGAVITEKLGSDSTLTGAGWVQVTGSALSVEINITRNVSASRPFGTTYEIQTPGAKSGTIAITGLSDTAANGSHMDAVSALMIAADDRIDFMFMRRKVNNNVPTQGNPQFVGGAVMTTENPTVGAGTDAEARHSFDGVIDGYLEVFRS